MKEDFKRLWATSFLDDLTIEVKDYAFTNGVVGKMVIYHMEERQRVKIVDYVGSKELEQTKIDEKLREENVQVRMDSFINDGLDPPHQGASSARCCPRRDISTARVTHEVKPMPAQGTKTVHLTFTIDEGPKYIVRDIDFVGNKAIGDRTLKRQMKETKERWMFSFVTGRGTYKDSKYEEDAEKVQGFYRDKGYLRHHASAIPRFAR